MFFTQLILFDFTSFEVASINTMNNKFFWEVLTMGKMDYLKEMPIAVLGGGAVGKTCAADMKLAGREVRLFDMMPFAEKTLAHLDRTGSIWTESRETSTVSNVPETQNLIWSQATWLKQ